MKNYSWLFHKQKTITVNKITIKVDEHIAEQVKALLKAGYRTVYSCQHEGPKTKKFPAYINPWGACCDKTFGDFELLPVPTIKQMVEILGLKKGEYRSRNGVLWFKSKYKV